MEFGFWEIFLLIVVVLIIFVGTRIIGASKNSGRGSKDFDDSKEEIHADGEKAAKKATAMQGDAAKDENEKKKEDTE